MIMNSETVTCLGGALLASPFNGNLDLVRSIWVVLDHGNGKHPDDDATPEQHLKAALRHIRRDGVDKETGASHRAHAAARCLLALVKISKSTAGFPAGREQHDSK